MTGSAPCGIDVGLTDEDRMMGLLGNEGDRVTEMKYDKLTLSRALLDTEESEAAVKGMK